MKPIVKLLLGFLFVLLMTAVNVLFAMLPSGMVWGVAITCTGGAILLACLLGNLIRTLMGNRALLHLHADAVHKEQERMSGEVRANVEGARNKLEKLFLRARLYSAAILLGVAVLSTGISMMLYHAMELSYISIPDTDTLLGGMLSSFVFTTVVFFFFGMETFATFLPPKKDSEMASAEDFLPREEYPLLYEIATKAAKTVGYDGPFALAYNLQNEGVSIAEEPCVVLRLPPLTAYFLTRDELYNIFLHEFAHVVNGDTMRSMHFHKLRNAFDCDRYAFLRLFKSVYYSAIDRKLEYELDLFRRFSSILAEELADQAVIDYGDAKANIDGEVKSLLLGIFLTYPRRELHYDFFASETARGDYYAVARDTFLPWVCENGEREVARLKRTLPSRSGTHPTLTMRMQAAGREEYDLTTVETDEKYRAETEKYLHACDEIRRGWDGWEEMHAQYLERLARIERYEEALCDGTMSAFDRYAAMETYQFIDRARTLELAEEFLAADENDGYANYYKGLILSERGDPRAHEYFYTAMIHAGCALAMSAFEQWGDACLETGDEELVARMRAQQAQHQQTIYNQLVARFRFGNPTPDSLHPADLTRPRTDALISSVKKLTEGICKHAYFCTTEKKGKRYGCFVIELREGVKSDDVNALHRNLSNCLDYFDSHDYAYLYGIAKRLDKRIESAKKVGIDLLN